MPMEAATTVAQIIPVLYVAWGIELGITVNPRLKGRRRTRAAIPLVLAIALSATVEMVLVRAIIYDRELHPIWSELSFAAVGTSVLLVVLPHLAEALGIDPNATFEKDEARRAVRKEAALERRARARRRGRRSLRRPAVAPGDGEEQGVDSE